MKKRLFSKTDLDTIEKQIKSFESSTSGQLVVVTAQKSDPYSSLPLRLGIFGIVFSSLAYFLIAWEFVWLPFPYLVCFQVFGFIAFFVFGKTDFAVLRFVPAVLLDLRVRKSAFASFVEKGVHETSNNSGILIYLSEVEHRVEILADTNAFKILGKETFQKEALKIVNGIKTNQATNAVCKSIEELAILLQQHFPKTTLNKNELSDEVHVE